MSGQARLTPLPRQSDWYRVAHNAAVLTTLLMVKLDVQIANLTWT